MAQVQTITITDTSGTTHDTVEALLTQMGSEVDTSTQVDFFEASEQAGLLIQDHELSEDGATVIITRNWTDARWVYFQAETGTPDFVVAGWTVVTEDRLVPRGLTTRMDTFVGSNDPEA